MTTVKIYDMTDTWNSSNTSFTSIKMNANDISSSANSLLIDLQVDGVSKFAVNKDGVIVAGIANTSYINNKLEEDLNVNSAIYSLNANNATYLGGKNEINLNVNNAITSSTLTGNVSADQVISTISGATGAVNVTVQDKFKSIIDVKDFGAVGDGIVNDTQAIKDAIIYANTVAPAIVMLNGIHNVGGNTSLFPINIKGGVTLSGEKGKIIADTPVVNSTGFPVTTNVKLLTMDSNSKLQNAYIDANSSFQYTVIATDVNNIEITDNEFVGWKYCVTVENKVKGANTLNNNESLFESSDIVVSRNKIHSAATSNVIYPLWFASKRGKWIYRATIENNTLIGYPGAYSATNDKTADMMELQGIADSVVSKNHCIDSGELGLAVVRLSKNVLLEGNIVRGADAGGIQVGTGAILTVANSSTINSSWGVNDIVYTNQADGSFVYGYFEALDGNDIYLRSISGGVFNPTDPLTNGIRIKCDTVTGFKTDMIVVGANTGARGKILRIADPDDVTKPKYLFVANVAGQSIQFANGEYVSNGAISRQIININRTLVANVAQANISSVLIDSTTRTNNISAVNNIVYNNGKDVTADKITVTTLANESLWNVGQTITGQTSGATANIEAITSTTISTLYLSSIVGSFSAGEIIKNASNNTLEIFSVGGIFSGIFVQQGDNIRVIGNACYDNVTPKTQDYGLSVSQCKNLFLAGNDFSGNAVEDTSFSGVYTLNPTNTYGVLATPRGKNITANGTITVTSSYTAITATSNVSISNILGGYDGQRLVISPSTNSNTVNNQLMSIITVVDTQIGSAGGNIRLAGGNFAMDSSYDTLELVFKYTGSGASGGQWLELTRSKNDGIPATTTLNMADNLTQNGTPTSTSIGFLGSPQITDQDDYTLTLADCGGHYYHVSANAHTLSIPANSTTPFPTGTVIGIINENGAGVVTVSVSDDTLRWGSSTGSRAIAPNGTASLLKVSSTVWRLTGDGIS